MDSMGGGLVVLFILQILACALLAVVVLLQSSDEDALSNISSGNSKFGSTKRKAPTDFITKFTILLGAFLMLNSAILTSISARKYARSKSLVKDYLERKASEKKPAREKTFQEKTPGEKTSREKASEEK
ncbi:MAG: preprotein translocase subunit SecG [Rickettsiales bacterium]|jgi:protein translocase SecG subunit|nr:preprotein translocase subunit SecG [Rickettsiales bacterium]